MRNQFVISFLLWALCIGSNYQSKAQELSPRDSAYVASLTDKLMLTLDQQLHVDSIYKQAQSEIGKLTEEKKSINTSELSEEQMALRLSVVNQKIKDVRTERKNALLFLLDAEQRKIFDTEIAPAKPNVLHFGIHNRMDCKVCTE